MKEISLIKLFSEKPEVFKKYFSLKKYETNAVIFRENSAGDTLFLIGNGLVSIEKSLNKEQTEFKELALLSDGDFFGEISVIEEKTRTAQARAVAETELYEVKRTDFFAFTKAFPEEGMTVMSNIMKISLNRLQHTSKELTLLFHITKFLTRTYSDEKDFLKEIVDETAFFFEGDWNIESYFYNYFNEEFDKAGSNCEFGSDEAVKLSDILENRWLTENMYTLVTRENDAVVSYILFNCREKLSQNERNNWATIFNTISFIVSSGLKNIKQYKELVLMDKLKNRKNMI